VSVGTGLIPALIVNVRAFEVPPPGGGFTTVTCAVPGDARSAAVSGAVSSPASPGNVSRLLPFHCTSAPEAKFAPMTVTPPVLPAGNEEGLSQEIVGTGLPGGPIANVRAPELPPPGAGFTTVSCAVPCAAMSVAGNIAATCVGLTRMVARSFPFHWMVELGTKPLPKTLSPNAPLPARAFAGARKDALGTALLAALAVNVTAFDAPPPGAGLTTVTCAMPGTAISVARSIAISCVLLTNVVCRLAPLHRAVEPDTKLLPLRVSAMLPEPAVVLDGESDVTPGGGLLMVKASALEVPPPGPAFTTVTCATPAAAMSLARIWAVSCEPLTNVVARLLPFHCTVEAEMKFEPFTVRENPGLPAVTLEEESELKLGAGLAGTGFGGSVLPAPMQPMSSAAAAKASTKNNRRPHID